MATFKIAIRESEKLKDGRVNIKIRVIHQRVTRFISSDYNCDPKYFDSDKGLLTVGGGYKKDEVDRINNKLQIQLGIAVRKARDQRNLEHMDMKSLMNILRDRRPEYDMFSVLNSRMEQFRKIGNINYHDTILRTKNAIEGFTGGFLLRFETIDANWLKSFEYHLRAKGLKSNTIGIHMRDIRTAYNHAITMGLADYSAYPFRKYHIPKEPTRHRTLTPTELSTIAHKEIKDQLTAWSRDMFMLSFYLIGINMKDLMFLNKVEDGRIYYIRSKGKKSYSIKVWQEAQEIIDRYPGKRFLLNTMDNYCDYRNATHAINDKLKKVAEICKIGKDLTTYWCRYSWATIGISKEVGLSKDDIRYALGHSTNTVSDIYIEYRQETIDLANRSVIKYILRTPPSE